MCLFGSYLVLGGQTAQRKQLQLSGVPGSSSVVTRWPMKLGPYLMFAWTVLLGCLSDGPLARCLAELRPSARNSRERERAGEIAPLFGQPQILDCTSFG